MNTTENNKLIAEFMGLLPKKDIGDFSEYSHLNQKDAVDTWCKGFSLSKRGTGLKWMLVEHNGKNLQILNDGAFYEVSDDKVEVWYGGKPIEDLKYATSWDWLMPVMKKIENEELLSFDIEQSYEKVIEHIKWYNEQQEDHEPDTLFCKNHPEVEALPNEEGSCSACGGDCNDQGADDKRHAYYCAVETILKESYGWTQERCEKDADIECYDQYFDIDTPLEAATDINKQAKG